MIVKITVSGLQDRGDAIIDCQNQNTVCGTSWRTCRVFDKRRIETHCKPFGTTPPYPG